MRHTKTLMSATSRKTSQMPSAPVVPRGRQRLPTAGSDEKRERILKAAEALFDRNGYANTTIEQIVQSLGVTKPFVYYYFRNKQEIFETLSWAPAVACFTAMDFAADDDRPAPVKVTEGIERLIRATLDGLKREASPRTVAQRRGKKVADILGTNDKPAETAADA